MGFVCETKASVYGHLLQGHHHDCPAADDNIIGTHKIYMFQGFMRI